jgi:hypothetical protein
VVTVTLTGGWTFADGSVIAIQGYVSAPSGNPAPGQFTFKCTPTNATMATCNITRNGANFFALHTVVNEP